jgi:hypothetical protein
MSPLIHPLPVIHEILHCATKGTGLFRMTVVFLAYPAYHAIHFTPFFPTPVRKEVLVSGESGNRVRIDVPDTPRIHPPNLSS